MQSQTKLAIGSVAVCVVAALVLRVYPLSAPHGDQWDDRLAVELPPGSALSVAEQWAKNNGFAIEKDKDPAFILLRKEIPGDGIVCRKWFVQIRLSFDAYWMLKKKIRADTGQCL